MTAPPPIPPPIKTVAHPPVSFGQRFRRHGFWAVPLAVVALLLAAVVVRSIYDATRRLSRPLPALEAVLQTTRASPRAIAALGQPIQSHGSYVSNEERGATTFSEIEVSVSGPDNDGLLVAEAEKRDGVWRATKLVLTMDGQPASIDLLAPADPAAEAAAP
jgi:type II secretory pathway component PulJ